MARVTKEQSEATAARILDVASELFARRGFATVGLDEVATGAGVTRGAVYHHFVSREGLFGAVHVRAQQAVAAAVTKATDGIDDAWAALEIGCRAFLDAAVGDAVRQVLLLDSPTVLGWAAWRDQDAATSGQLLWDVLTELSAEGVIRVGPVGACHAVLTGAMNEAVIRAASSVDVEESIDETWPVILRLLESLRGPAR